MVNALNFTKTAGIVVAQSNTKFYTTSHKVKSKQKPFKKHNIVVLINYSKMNSESALSN